jgi:integrase
MAYLRLREGRFVCILAVPLGLRHALGKAKLERGLQTGDLSVANARKWAVLAEFRDTFTKAASGESSALLDDAKAWRRDIEAAHRTGDVDRAHTLELAASDALDRVAERKPSDALRFHKALKGALSIREHLAAWNRDGAKPNTQRQRTMAVESLLASLGSPDAYPEEVTPEAALKWADGLHKAGLAGNTRRGRVSLAAAFWSYLQSRLAVPMDKPSPFAAVRVSDPRSLGKRTAERRAFTPTEVRTLLARTSRAERPSDAQLQDVALVGLFCGFRAGELLSLTAADVEVDARNAAVWLTVREGKTRSSARTVPVVNAAAVRLLKGLVRASNGGPIFPHWHGREASFSSLFGRWRKRVLPGSEGVDAHSTRRSYATALEHHGAEPLAAMRLLGHRAPGLSFSTYSKSGSKAQLLKAARCVRY